MLQLIASTHGLGMESYQALILKVIQANKWQSW
jgi:hypothetical protein